jgi:hypothetical protein
MSDTNAQKSVEYAAGIMARFADRTGIGTAPAGPHNRYLWTDAFAVLNYLSLAICDKSERWEALALQLIRDVHEVLGQYAPEDTRGGWLSGMEEKEATQHPTIAGLRIGKSLPERLSEEPYDQQREWDRDGQYYHYHTRWITALLQAGRYFEEEKFFTWAAELSLAGAPFIEEKGGRLKMYWKMSVDLSRPLVPVMGAHDPLEGLLCALQCSEHVTLCRTNFELYIRRLEQLCKRVDWTTDDALGLGGLLLNVVRAADLQRTVLLPACVSPARILRSVEEGLRTFADDFKAYQPPSYRLAFRECGLSLGLRAIMGHKVFLTEQGLEPVFSTEIMGLPDLIEAFWQEEGNQRAVTYTEHLDINEVSLASSMLAHMEPEIFARFPARD